MWPDMHSFLEFDKFEPISYFKFLFEKLITCFVLAIWQTSIVRRFWNLTDSERFWLEFCQIPKTTNQNDSRDDFSVRRFRNLTKFEPKSLRKCQIPKTANNWSLSNYQNEARDRFFEEKLRIWDWFEFVKFRKRMHIRPRDNRIFQMDFVKFHWHPRK